MSGNAHYAALASQVTGLQVSLARLSLAEALSWLLGLIDEAIGLAQDLVAAIFDAIKAALADVDKQFGDRIGIPLVTALYEQVITKGGTPSVYSIGALLGAVPLTVMSKLMHGTLPFSAPANTPFPAWPFDAQGKPVPRQAPAASPR
ncbi:MAG TPA: hypothetical protein VMK84_22485 [Streptosporangiaceae bacterium]|nr:hypothetical protein [Streptosporangiaceae bacterium]